MACRSMVYCWYQSSSTVVSLAQKVLLTMVTLWVADGAAITSVGCGPFHMYGVIAIAPLIRSNTLFRIKMLFALGPTSYTAQHTAAGARSKHTSGR